MSSSIYEEALADVKKLKEVAEQNAKNAIIDAVTPKIREMIEKQLIGDTVEESEQGDILADLAESLLGADADDITLTSESLKALSGLVNNTSTGFSSKDAELTSLLVQERLLVVMDDVTSDGPDINELAEMKQEIFKTYQCLVENKNIINDDDFNRIQKRLASLDYFLTEAIGENEMNERNLRNILDEETLNLVLDLGDDVELDADAVTVNVVQPDEDEVAEEDIDTAEEPEVEADDKFMADELGDAEDLTRTADDDSVATAGDGIAESDEMLEINEEQLASMIRSILNEDDDAGDADEQDMDELDSDTADEHEATVVEEDYNEVMMESDGLTDDTVVEISETMLRDELTRMRQLRESTNEPIEITESNIGSDQTNKVMQLKTQLQEYEKAVSSLRNQLDESNLFNAKLLYANKLLQNRDLNDRQRVNIVESLDDAKSLREVRLLYKSLVDSTNTKSNLTESKRRRAAGSASRPTRTGSVSKESYPETDRWALLAGLNK